MTNGGGAHNLKRIDVAARPAAQTRTHEPIQAWYGAAAAGSGARWMRVEYSVRRPVDAAEIMNRQAELAPAVESVGLAPELAPAKPPRRGDRFDVVLEAGTKARLTVFAPDSGQRAALAAAFRRATGCSIPAPAFGVPELLLSLLGAAAIGAAAWVVETAVITFAPMARGFVPISGSIALDGIAMAAAFLPVLVVPSWLAAYWQRRRLVALDDADARAADREVAAAAADRTDPAP